jgi:hypothetical protein
MIRGETTVATAVAVVPIEFFAVTVHDAGTSGAVNRPLAEMVPQEAENVALLLAVNCCVAPSVTVGRIGVTVSGAGAGPILSYPYTVYFGFPVAIPSTVQKVPTDPAAVKRPPAVIEPQPAVHATGTLAVNCCVIPRGVVADTGVIMIGETTVTVAVELPLPLVAFAVTVQEWG